MHKEKRVYFKRAMGYFKKTGELFMEASSVVFAPLTFCVFGEYRELKMT